MGSLEKMKLIALCVFAFACYSVIESAPVREELLQNIEDAAESKVAKEESQAANYNAQAETEEAQLASNEKFAQNLSEKVQSQNEKLALMSSDEKKTITDAKTIEDDTKSADTSDIEAKDMDAEDKSEEIQQTAEEVDTVLLASMKKMRAVGIEGELKAAKLAGKKAAQAFTKQKTTKLGEDPDEDGDDEEDDDEENGDEDKVFRSTKFPTIDKGTYKARLSAIEDDAHKMVDTSKADEQTAEQRVKKDEMSLNEMANMAATGMAQLKKSEARLHRDLNGNRDRQLEEDIEKKAKEIDGDNNKLGENDDPLAAAEEAAEAADDDADESADDETAVETAADDSADDESQLDTSASFAQPDIESQLRSEKQHLKPSK